MRTRSRKRRKIRKWLDKLYKVTPYCCFIILGVLYVRYWMRGANLKKNRCFTIGYVVRFSGDYRGAGGTIHFKYHVKGENYEEANAFVNLYKYEGYRFEGKTFPVAYDSTDYSNSRILITTADFKDFLLPFPDSLQWVKQYQRNY